MPLYEHVFLARQDLAQAQVDALAENATKIIEDNGGKVVKTETWGLRSIAYRIAKNRKAHYVMLDIDAPAPALAELERQTGINEDIIRFMTIRVDAHEKGPSAMMRRQERDRSERGDRGPRGDDRGGFRGDRGKRRVHARERGGPCGPGRRPESRVYQLLDRGQPGPRAVDRRVLVADVAAVRERVQRWRRADRDRCRHRDRERDAIWSGD